MKGVEMKKLAENLIETPRDNHDKILSLFVSPKLIGIVGDANSGKSNLLYFVISQLRETYSFGLYTYGLRAHVVGEQKIYSVEQLEVIHDSIIIIDEFASMFDIDDRREKKQIEQTLRLIFHNNNVVLLCGLPENYKKFIASKLDAVIFKRCALGDFINGSRVKKIAFNYRGYELGAAVLNVENNSAIVYNGSFYHRVRVPYIEATDTKASNAPILRNRSSKRS
jgi:hypothetical protein